MFLDNDKPVMTASESQPVEEVTNVTLTCSDRTSDNVTGYLWYKNGFLIGESTNMKLSLPNNTRADDGQYSCEVNTNKVPKSSMSNMITINFLCKSSSCLILYHPNCLHIQQTNSQIQNNVVYLKEVPYLQFIYCNSRFLPMT